MKVILCTEVIKFPKRISAREALDFYEYEAEMHDILMVMAAHWRENPEPGEEDWFEELGVDDFEVEDFLEEFSEATLELWARQTKGWIVQTRKEVLWMSQ